MSADSPPDSPRYQLHPLLFGAAMWVVSTQVDRQPHKQQLQQLGCGVPELGAPLHPPLVLVDLVAGAPVFPVARRFGWGWGRQLQQTDRLLLPSQLLAM